MNITPNKPPKVFKSDTVESYVWSKITILAIWVAWFCFTWLTWDVDTRGLWVYVQPLFAVIIGFTAKGDSEKLDSVNYYKADGLFYEWLCYVLWFVVAVAIAGDFIDWTTALGCSILILWLFVAYRPLDIYVKEEIEKEGNYYVWWWWVILSFIIFPVMWLFGWLETKEDFFTHAFLWAVAWIGCGSAKRKIDYAPISESERKEILDRQEEALEKFYQIHPDVVAKKYTPRRALEDDATYIDRIFRKHLGSEARGGDYREEWAVRWVRWNSDYTKRMIKRMNKREQNK